MARDVNPFELCQPLQQCYPVNPLFLGCAHDRGKLHHRLLAVANDGTVEEVGQRFGVEGAGTADDDEGVRAIAVGAPAGDAGKVKHVEDIAVGQLVLQGESDQIKFPQGALVLQGSQGDFSRAQLRLEIRPRRIGALGGGPVEAVENMVEDGKAEVAHADFVNVGKGQGDTNLDPGPLFVDAPHLAAKVAGRALD